MSSNTADLKADSRSERLRQNFGLDVRSLALFRVFIALVAIYDLVARSQWLHDFYTDQGVLPRPFLIDEVLGKWEWTFLLLSGQYWVQVAMFLFSGFCALLMLVGYRTRLSTFFLWLMICSIHLRLPLTTHGGDDLLRMLLFWAWLVPLNLSYSLDRALDPREVAPPSTILSWGAFGLMLQLLFMYIFSALLKWDPVWHTEGSAIYYALSLDLFARPIGTALLNFPSLMQFMTYATLALEFVGPVLVFSPVRTGSIRMVTICLFVGFHVSLASTIHLGTFPWICSIAWFIFLPSHFWSWMGRKLIPDELSRHASQTTIFYDGECAFCWNMVRIIRELMILPQVKIDQSHGNLTAQNLMSNHRSWVIRNHKGEFHVSFSAFVELAQLSPIFRWAAPVLRLKPFFFLGETAYRFTASRRRTGAHLLPVREQTLAVRYGPATEIFALIFIGVGIFANVRNFESLHMRTPDFLRAVISVTNTFQKWNLFAPYPIRDDGWYVVDGTLMGGEHRDLRTGQLPRFEKPTDVASTYIDPYWRKYLMSLWEKKNGHYRLPYGRYLCREWNQAHKGSEQVNFMHIYFMLERTPPPGDSSPPAQKELIWRHYCFEKPEDW